MEIVADTNIIAAAILRNGPTRNFLFSQSLRVFSPDYLNEELAEHEKEFERKSGLSRKRFMQAKELVLSQLMEIPKEEYDYRRKESLVIAPDKDDWPYFALAMHLKCAIWSNDKRLKEQDSVKVLSTKELLGLFLRP